MQVHVDFESIVYLQYRRHEIFIIFEFLLTLELHLKTSYKNDIKIAHNSMA